MSDLGATMGAAVAALGIDRFNLMATSFGGRPALWLALQQPDRVLGAGARIAGGDPPGRAPAAVGHAGGDRTAALCPSRTARRRCRQPIPAVQAKQRALVGRLRGPDRDADLEAPMRDLATPTLVLFGTLDRVMPPEMGRCYKALLPNCHLVFVYDAGHEISTDRPEAFAEVTADFLERHEAFVINRTETVIHP